ncbi:MAG: hypothetical protein A3A28_00535 [Candidatus Sungbacteria bacterium RIFCSPLOWO2_01_FULL_47_32]|uniref:Extracellular solute-binding protein n=1 Tax=Candidatus Sungbacteria bacterium RIFCSPHIGHO2_01_FULL_47_32 TaxID=1802264 RepID=A0A1G2K8J8_9BACT|nr:MAG: hypothetical protein UX72_C0034G0033 [Parcubacteria group bacterium GW2011_GWA2_47_10]OGZ95705.1 MAG: hypothetical protein A2633_01865 [Candidatus Sungbacteria bacterium RIFCSPHIGHO2_01_FULL_47_32]OGZ98248.1 MAG: hypothetical protein A3D57_05170 [Candidatus Sungbacteria bacterium RIFCSPHIGHO2_02_FULL_46_12]OHA05344.1 MAG: hypothetical protein A3A28_00535 [Candidatus Sungbacteria bacterium RIFCSPLOWO2_01_FULL_47_32]
MGSSRISSVQLIIFGLIAFFVLIALLLLLGIIGGGGNSTQTGGDLTVWGFDEEGPWRTLSSGFTAKNTGIRITYKQISKDNYESELVNALAAGNGPDVFMLKNSNIHDDTDKISSVADAYPATEKATPIIERDEFKRTFVDGTYEGLVTPAGDILGLPLSLDSLVLFYNKDFFNSANIPSPPQTWTDFLNDAAKLNDISPDGSINRSGGALGEYTNIDHFADIVSAFIFQAGGRIYDPVKNQVLMATPLPSSQSIPAHSAVEFYTSFASPKQKNYSWNRTFPNSTDAFIQEKTAMMLGFAGDIKTIREQNPHLNFMTAPLPQLSKTAPKVYYGRYNFLAVSHLSKLKALAWRFVYFAATHDAAKKYITETSLPPARRDLVLDTKTVPDELVAFYNQSLSAKTWIQPGESRVSDIFADMIDAVLRGKFDVGSAVSRATSALSLLVQKR